jgi:hypothetical protein
VFKRSDIEGAAKDLLAEFGADAEQEVRERHARAAGQRMNVTASFWEQVLQRMEELRRVEIGNPDEGILDVC